MPTARRSPARAVPMFFADSRRSSSIAEMIADVVIEALDILYVPSRDVAADVAYYRDVLGGRVVWAIEAMGTRVAEVALAGAGPRLVLAEHLAAGESVVLHRIDDLDAALAA